MYGSRSICPRWLYYSCRNACNACGILWQVELGPQNEWGPNVTARILASDYTSFRTSLNDACTQWPSGQVAASACLAAICFTSICFQHFAASNLLASFGFQYCMGPRRLSCRPLFVWLGHRTSRWLNTLTSYTTQRPL